jgi:hypothetical protein
LGTLGVKDAAIGNMVLVNFRANFQSKVLGFAHEEQVHAPFASFGEEIQGTAPPLAVLSALRRWRMNSPLPGCRPCRREICVKKML